MSGPLYIAELCSVVAAGQGAAARATLALAGVPKSALMVREVRSDESGEIADGIYCLKAIACCESEAREFAEGCAQSNPDLALHAFQDWPHPTDKLQQRSYSTPAGTLVVFPSVELPEVT